MRIRPGGHISRPASPADNSYKKKLQEIESGLKNRAFLFENPSIPWKKTTAAEPEDIFTQIMREAGLAPEKY
jgi:hypothetical protein